ncbi:MAG: HAMP domain-containing protein [Chloroflexi bacterium]|nr:HAMP domain-containing protein [Chloroflexota bacterium]
MSLFPKLLLSFMAVVLVGVAVVSFLANQVAAREVRGFMFQGGMTTESGMAQELAGYYRGRGSWEGAQTLISADHMMGGMMSQRLIIADAQGQIVADSDGRFTGQRLSNDELASGLPIEVDGAQVGTLLAAGSGPGMMMGGFGSPGQASEDELLFRVNRAIFLAAAVAGGLALVIGGLLAYGLVRPIRQLTSATGAVARGDLSHRVPVSSNDEIGELATSFNAMSADLEKAEGLRRSMMADIAHELRNPIAVLQANLEAVIDGVLPPSAENLQPLLDQSQLLARLVDDLRTLALAEAGQLSLNRALTDPAEVVRSVVAQFTRQAEAKTLSLQTNIAPNLPQLALDSQRIAQVLGNLLSNAIRHTPEDGRIECRVTSEARQVTFAVSDTGSGISAEALPHIFERFYRADSSRSRAGGGTGLGLSIAKQLVELHGGKIWAESDGAPGKGTRVSFALPLN